MNRDSILKTGLICTMILVAVFSRLMPHPPNFTALGAMALFGAAQLRSKWLAFLVPMFALFISDLVINNIIYGGAFDHFVWMISPFVYLSILGVTGLGFLLRNRVKPVNVAAMSLIASILFFVVTNLGAWVSTPIYTKDFTGLGTAFLAGVPFFGGTLTGDLFFSTLLFGAFELARRYVPALQTVSK